MAKNLHENQALAQEPVTDSDYGDNMSSEPPHSSSTGEGSSRSQTDSSGTDDLYKQAEQLSELGAEWTATLRETVREHPLAALLAAAAVGMLIARVTR